MYCLKKIISAVLLLNVMFVVQIHSQVTGEAKNAGEWSIKAANTIMSKKSSSYGEWDYVVGTVMRGFEEVWRKTNDIKYYNYIKKTVDASVEGNGSIKEYKKSDYNIDEICEGRAVLLVYKETNDSRYKKAAESLYDQLQSHPRTSDGGFWHKKKYESQMWLDGLYMGSPFYAEYGKVFNKSDAFADVAKQVFLMEKHLRDNQTGLLYHGWDEKKKQKWANSSTGRSESFWGRAMGWYGMAILDILDNIPSNFQHRDSLIHTFQRFAKAIVKYQDESGCWYQVVDQGTRSGNYLEASASCMYVYSLAKGIRLGYLDNSYLDEVVKGYNGIISKFVSGSSGTVKLNKICKSAGLGSPDTRDGTFEYYVGEDIVSDDGKGLGPFLSAGIEVSKISTVSTISQQLLVNKSELTIINNQSTRSIQFIAPSDGVASVKIYSANGTMVLRKNVLCTVGSNTVGIDDELQSHGVYMISVLLDNSSKTALFRNF